tara:strand:- start:26 stop:493 length:468 start_codon:yes stop_codon:yes gene_type:complete
MTKKLADITNRSIEKTKKLKYTKYLTYLGSPLIYEVENICITKPRPVTKSIIVPDKPSRRNSNLISGSGNHVYNFKEIGLNLSKSRTANIKSETVNDKSAPFIVINVVNLSFNNVEIEFKNIETIKGIKTTTNRMYSIITLSKTSKYQQMLFPAF